jgi:fatty-acyl-CoA synthase
VETVSVTPLTPLAFLGRAAAVFPDKTAVVMEDRRVPYRDFAGEVTRLARALRASGVAAGDRVAYLCPNIPESLTAQFAVPLAGGVLVAINTRLSGEEIRYILDHCGAVLLIIDRELHPQVAPVLDRLQTVREVVVVGAEAPPREEPAEVPEVVPHVGYTALLARGSDDPLPWAVADELSPISINYTSGTTGAPKGVIYTHRGAYLNSFAQILHAQHSRDSVYLWTLPMFHCNGWCTGWALAAVAGTQVCLREVRGEVIWRLLREEGITHLNGAPTVLATITDAPEAAPLDRELIVTVAGAPPSPTVIARMSALGARVIHVYGLTETYGPYTINEAQPGWPAETAERRAKLQSRQGVAMVTADPVRVVDGLMNDVPRDGTTMGEIVMRGNTVMTGYFRDPEGTADAFTGGWFHSGDLGVMHPDGYVELRDRAKDVVISGGENIATIEVEHALASHPAVLEAVVVGAPDEKWGEVVKAFVVLRPGLQASEEELLAHVRTQIARYKTPKMVTFVGEFAKTATGKVLKYELREKEWAGHTRRIQG